MSLPLGKVEDLKKGDKQIGVGNADVAMLAGIRDQRQSRAQAARRWRCSSRRSSSSSRSTSRPTRGRRTGRCCLRAPGRGLRRARERRVPREDAGRDQARRAARRRNPTRGRQAAGDRQPRKTTMERAAQGGHQRLHAARHRLLGAAVAHVPEQPAAGVPAARRGLLLPRLRVRAGGRHGQRAARLPRPHHEDAELEVHPERVPRLRRAVLQRGAWATRRSGSPPSRRTLKVIAKPPPENKVYGYAWYKLGLRLLEPGRPRRTRSTRSRRRSTSARRTRSCRTRRSSPTARARTSSRSTRSRASPTRGLQLLQEPERRPGGLERQDVQDDGRPGPELPGHRSLSRGHRRSTRT